MNCLLLLLLFLASPARPASPWLRITSANFELYTNAGEKKGREAILYFEQVRALFDKLAKSKDTPALPVRIIAFQSETEYEAYRSSDSADAFYVSGQDRDYIVMKSIASQFYPVAIHQYVHLLIKHSGLDLPVWLNEGLAEVYSPLKAVGSQVQLGDILFGRVYELKNNKWLDFPTLLSVDRNSPLYDEKQKAGIFYSESWALTHMLSLSNEYSKKFPDFLGLIKAGDSQAAVFEKIYGKTLSELQEELPIYMRGSRFNAARVNVRLEKSTESPEIKTVTDVESRGALADLQAVTHTRALVKPEHLTEPVSAVPVPPKRDVEPNVQTAPPERSAAPVQSVQQRAPPKRDAESNVQKARPKRSAAPVQAVQPPAPPIRDAEPNVQAAPPERSAAPVQSVQQPAEPKREVETKVATTRPKRPVKPVQAVQQPAEPKRDVETTVAATRPEHPVEPVPAPQQPVPQRRDEEPAEASTRSAEGTLQQIDCAGKAARLRILVAGQQMMLLIEDVNRVSMKTAGKQVTHEFVCGPQEPVTVAIQYAVKSDPMFKTEGLVRTLEFR